MEHPNPDCNNCISEKCGSSIYHRYCCTGWKPLSILFCLERDCNPEEIFGFGNRQCRQSQNRKCIFINLCFRGKRSLKGG